jgi:hypothetical protein
MNSYKFCPEFLVAEWEFLEVVGYTPRVYNKWWGKEYTLKAGSLKMNTALEYSTRVVQEGGRRCKKSTINDLLHLTPLRIPLMNPP